MRCSRLAVFATVLVGLACGEPPTPFEPTLELSFPDARADGSLPFEPGGRLRVSVRFQAPEGTRACGALKANVALVHEALPSESVATVATLVPQRECADHAGTVTLSYPPGGDVLVRAAVSGVTQEQIARLDLPRLAVGTPPGAQSRSGLSVSAPVCIESSSTKGTLVVELTGALLVAPGVEPNKTKADLPLAPGGCDPPSSGITAWSHVDFTAVVSGGAFSVTASLTGTSAPVLREELPVTIAGSPLLVSVLASTASLPPAGGQFSVTAHVELGGSAVAGIPVRFAALPQTALLPAEAVTDASGNVTTHVVVPPDVSAVRVEATVGAQRLGVTVP